MNREQLNRLGSLAVCALFFIFSASAMADTTFEGKTIKWIVPFAESGGSDTWARFNAKFLSRHLPGKPMIEIINEPGGSGTRGPNTFARKAKPNGLTVLGTSGSTQFPYLLGDLRVQYDYRDWEVLAVAPTGGVIYVAPETGVDGTESIKKLLGQTLVFPSQGPTSLDLVPMLAFRLLGLDVSYVFGYMGRHDGIVAMDRDEATIDYQTTASYLRNVLPRVHDGRAVPLMSLGVLDEDGSIVRDPTFPDLPTVEEVYEMLHGEPPSGIDYDAYRTFKIAGFAGQKMVVLPQETPAEIIEVWRQAWRDTLSDPEYRATVHSVLGAYEQVTDRAAELLFREATTIEPHSRRYIIDLLSNEYAVRLRE